MLTYLKATSATIGLQVDLSKTQNLTPKKSDMQVKGPTIENVTEYVYLRHLIKLGKEKQTPETVRRTTQRSIEGLKLGIVLRDRIRNVVIRRRTRVKDVVSIIVNSKCIWVGYVARQDTSKWTKQGVLWRP